MLNGRLAAWLGWRPERLSEESLLDAWARATSTTGHPLNLYVHVPFCRSSCRFCMYYHQVPKRVDEAQEAWLQVVLGTLDRFHARLGRVDAQYGYIGGGTPSLLSTSQLERLLAALGRDVPDVDWPARSTID